VLADSTGLSAAGVTHALERCLETKMSDAEFGTIQTRAEVYGHAARVHVLLSANVFTAALRAVALGLSCGDAVCVRASRREPHFLELLQAATRDGADELFEIVEQLEPAAGEPLFAYGRDETLQSLSRSGIDVFGFGFGFGIAVVEGEAVVEGKAVADGAADSGDSLEENLEKLALDVAAFDQRGCMSPRLLVVVGSDANFERVCSKMTAALEAVAHRLPLGHVDEAEQDALAWYRTSLCGPYEIVPVHAAGRSQGGLAIQRAPGEIPSFVSPGGRWLSVHRVLDETHLSEALRPLEPFITSFGSSSERCRSVLRRQFPGARSLPLGGMQSIPLDGPVDLRSPLWR
jgi:hypothetical protein